MRPGDVFGENALITGLPRSASALAHETTAVLRIGGPAFLSALDREPLLSRRLLVLAARRLSEGNERERALAFLNAGARIARILLTFDEMDRQTADKGYITVSQDELAQRTGLTRQTVARFLGDWRRQDYLITGRGRIMLLQRRALQALLEEENII
jgi:CRP-like cAMP-binding protein